MPNSRLGSIEMDDLATDISSDLFGGGCREIEVYVFPTTSRGPMVVLHLLVDVRDAPAPTPSTPWRKALR
jgi:hypothetical protein